MQNQGLDPTAYELPEGKEYVPYVRQDGMAEFTIKAVASGIVLGIIFGAANTYLGLMAGLTISTSIPVAVLTVVLFRALSAVGGTNTILEANISQTTGSASSSVASGVLFTIPALFLWDQPPALLQLTLLAMSGGALGILIMIPLRRFLIVREHGKLPYPEGLACAEVLVASKDGGSAASNVFWGLGFGFVMKFISDGIRLVGNVFQVEYGRFGLSCKVSPALIGVGYILGPKIASVMVGGALLASFGIIPVLGWYGQGMSDPIYPGDAPISDMSNEDLHKTYVRYIGAGAVAMAGFLTLLRSIPTMIESFQVGLKQLRNAGGTTEKRTDQDLSIRYVLLGVAIIIAVLTFVPGILGVIDSVVVRGVAALLIGVFAFFFVTVASRIVGLVGVTSNPVSGMTIATLLATSFIFFLLGWTDIEGKVTALMVGTVVCIAASISGDTSQDLKTGFLLGATPKWQQIGEILGALTSALFVCLTLFALDASPGIGSQELPAPQGTLMKLIIDGVIEQKLPWTLIGIGAGLAIVVTLVRLPALAFAVGVYLPLSTMMAIFLGGILRYVLTVKQSEEVKNRRREQGVLFGSGLVGGEGLMGVCLALFVLISGQKKFPGLEFDPWTLQILAVVGISIILGMITWSACRQFHSLDGQQNKNENQ